MKRRTFLGLFAAAPLAGTSVAKEVASNVGKTVAGAFQDDFYNSIYGNAATIDPPIDPIANGEVQYHGLGIEEMQRNLDEAYSNMAKKIQEEMDEEILCHLAQGGVVKYQHDPYVENEFAIYPSVAF